MNAPSDRAHDDARRPGVGSALLSAVGAQELQRIQDTFAEFGQVTLLICDPSGNLLTRPSYASEYCRSMLASPTGLAACRESVQAALSGAEGRVSEVCQAGVVQFVAPVRVDPPPADPVAFIVLCDRLASEAEEPAPAAPADRNTIAVDASTRPAAEPGTPEDRRRESVTRFLTLLAHRLATLCRQHEQMSQRVRELEAVHDLTGWFAGTRDLPDVLRSTAERICRVVGVKSCSIRLLDEETGLMRIEAGHNLSQAYLERGTHLLEDNPIDQAAFAGETVYIPNVPADPRTRDPQLAAAEGLVSGLGVPMTYRGQTVGVIRVYTGRESDFSGFQCALLRSIGSQIAAAIRIYRLHEDQVSAERHQRHVQNAAAIQRRMMPGHQRTHGPITFGCVYSPALDVGGDFFDFIDLPEGNLGFCVADVVGKGIAAALMMASVRAALRAHAHSIYNLDEIVSLVNVHLCRDTLLSEFATMLYGVFSADGKRLTYCNAGHEPGLLFRKDRIIELSSGGMVIGVSPESKYSRGVIDLKAGDVLVAFTDGVTEALDFQDRAFGHDRVIESVRKYADQDALTLARQLLWDVRRFVGLAPQTDDITVVAARVGP